MANWSPAVCALLSRVHEATCERPWGHTCFMSTSHTVHPATCICPAITHACCSTCPVLYFSQWWLHALFHQCLCASTCQCSTNSRVGALHRATDGCSRRALNLVHAMPQRAWHVILAFNAYAASRARQVTLAFNSCTTLRVQRKAML